MQEAIAPSLKAWESFYVIVGSAGAALTGLQFVVIALIADSRRRSSSESIAAFGTPTIVHFCTVLLVGSVLSAPFRTLSGPAVILGIVGAAGVAYVAVVTRRARRQTDYRPVLEDWIWHTGLPFLAYATLLAGATGHARYPTQSLFAIGATSVLLLFIGIHNAWDTVTYVTLEKLDADKPPANDAQHGAGSASTPRRKGRQRK